jgi:hypothetical protein
MEDDLNKKKMEDDLKKIKMEDDQQKIMEKKMTSKKIFS